MLRRGGRSDACEQPEARLHAERSGRGWRWSDMPTLLGIIGVFAFGSGVQRSCPCRRPLREGEPESMAAADRPERVDGRRGRRPSEDVARHAERRSDGAHRIRKRPQPQETAGSGPGGEQPADRPGRVPLRASGERTSEPPGISGPLLLQCRRPRPAGTCDARTFTAAVPVSSKVAIQGRGAGGSRLVEFEVCAEGREAGLIGAPRVHGPGNRGPVAPVVPCHRNCFGSSEPGSEARRTCPPSGANLGWSVTRLTGGRSSVNWSGDRLP